MVWGWFGGGWGMVCGWLGDGWRWFGLIWGWFGGVVGGQWDGEIRVTIRAGLLSHWPDFDDFRSTENRFFRQIWWCSGPIKNK